jgi:hypothetical protein
MATDPSIQSVSLGMKYVHDKPTGDESIVFAVNRKLAKSNVSKARVIPRSIADVLTDVQERTIFAPPPPRSHGDIQSLTGKERPCPPGYSIGHYLITAGTLGAYVKRGDDNDWIILSNNHVLANSNATRPNAEIRQPGPHDATGVGTDRFGALEDYVEINWDGGELPGCNPLARALRVFQAFRGIQAAIPQPYPNLVDAAVYPGPFTTLKGIRDLQLGDSVFKWGRTTEETHGTVEGIGAMVRVNYGSGKTATFDNQKEIRANDGGDFSAGGDSGSVIINSEGFMGGLLFAGGGGVTIANSISDVVSLLGVRL